MTNTRLYIADLLLGGWKKMDFDPFKDGIEICLLHDGSLDNSIAKETTAPKLNEPAKPDILGSASDALLLSDQPSIALLRYAPGATVPRHKHIGVETIIVLEGSQSDEQGTYKAGSIVINPVGSEHSVWSDDGCVVFIQWDKPVLFI